MVIWAGAELLVPPPPVVAASHPPAPWAGSCPGGPQRRAGAPVAIPLQVNLLLLEAGGWTPSSPNTKASRRILEAQATAPHEHHVGGPGRQGAMKDLQRAVVGSPRPDPAHDETPPGWAHTSIEVHSLWQLRGFEGEELTATLLPPSPQPRLVP